MAKSRLSPWVWMLLLLFAAVGASAVQARKANTRKLDKVLYAYEGAVRSTEFEAAWAFVDPAYRLENPLSEFDIERYKQIQISGYLLKGQETISETEIGRLVEIRVINKHTQTERVVTERERWRWDAQAKSWWLTTGLPKLSKD